MQLALGSENYAKRIVQQQHCGQSHSADLLKIRVVMRLVWFHSLIDRLSDRL